MGMVKKGKDMPCKTYNKDPKRGNFSRPQTEQKLSGSAG
jgi:hypothetical protein